MRDEMGVLIGRIYLVFNFPLSKDGQLSDWRAALLFPQTNQYIVTDEANRFSCFLGHLGRENMYVC